MISGLRRMCRSWTGLAAILLIGVVTISAGGCRRGRRGSNGTSGSDAEDWKYHRTGLVGAITASEYPGDDRFYFEEGDTVALTVTVTDENGFPIDISTENLVADRLYIYGPLDQSKTVTCQNLLHTTSASAYAHLATDDVEWIHREGNVATFETGEITDEEPGTYRAVVWLTSATETWARTVVYTEFQIKTPVVETETVAATQCAPCHLGADSGKYYFHHIDPGYSPTGNYELDQLAVVSCKACHNQSGYANTSDNWDAAYTKTPDPIIRRVHGIHMGEELKSPRNTHRMALAAPPIALPGMSFLPTNPEDPTTSACDLIHGMTSGAEAWVISSDGLTHFVLGHVEGTFIEGETVDCVKITTPTNQNWSALTLLAANHVGTAIVDTSLIYDSAGNSEEVTVQEGYFADYTPVVFPPDVRDCTKCHIDDNWKNKPSKAACSACHDNIWWGDDTLTPEGFKDHEFEIGDIVAGVPGSDMNQGLCNGCHSESTFSIATAHEIPEYYLDDEVTPASPPYSAELSITPPLAGSYYLPGDTPKVYITVIDNATGLKVDPALIDDSGANKWSTASLYVSGPRSGHAAPVLTTTAKGIQVSVSNATAQSWTFLAGELFVLDVNGTVYTLDPPDGVAYTAAAFIAWLNTDPANVAFQAVALAVPSGTTKVTIKNKPGAAGSMIDVKVCGVATRMGWPTGRASFGSTRGNDLRERTDAATGGAWNADPKVSWNSVDMRIEYQLDNVAGLTPGTYAIYVDIYKTVRPDASALITFEVGTPTPDKYIATNCTDCHGDRHMHLDAGGRHPVKEFNTDYCKNCHDWQREAEGSDVWAAFGADPIIKKVHGIHYGAYIDYPRKIYVNRPVWGGIIFPQDVRNCSKCHPDDTTTGTWNTEPSRLACGSCHDSDSDEAHMLLQTVDPTPVYDAVTKRGGSWSGDEVESCKACHGEGNEFEAKKVHNISDPYVPPYPREKE